MEKLIFANENGSIELGLKAPFILQTVDGIGNLTARRRTQQSPFQHGTTQIASYFNERDIGLTFTGLASSEADIIQLRRQVQKLFNPLIESTLTYIRGDYSKEIKCYAASTPKNISSEKTSFRQQFVVTLICNDPFWLDIEHSGEVMSFSIANFGFELEIEEEGVEFEVEGTNRTVIYNDGDIETPVEIIFEGPASNPKIINETTGEYIQVDAILGNNEKLIINTEFGNKQVIFDDGTTQINAFNLVTIDSTFWSLVQGENFVSYTADSGIDVANVTINYRNRYIGL